MSEFNPSAPFHLGFLYCAGRFWAADAAARPQDLFRDDPMVLVVPRSHITLAVSRGVHDWHDGDQHMRLVVVAMTGRFLRSFLPNLADPLQMLIQPLDDKPRSGRRLRL